MATFKKKKKTGSNITCRTWIFFLNSETDTGCDEKQELFWGGKTYYTGANRLVGVDIPTRLCMTYARVTCVTSKLNGGDNSYLSSVLTSHMLHT